ncbi:hypothetical protein Pat9b_4035 (plasmid) [Pantoea sp. At-9b]|nr:hypothetical protein Pat9b_4035 [Pantoea sp. At-9b]
MRQGKASKQRVLFPGGGACYASGKLPDMEESGSGEDREQVIAVREYNQGERQVCLLSLIVTIPMVITVQIIMT